MTELVVKGGRPLNGTALVPAAKNSVLPLMAASLLVHGVVHLKQVPMLADVKTSMDILQSLGAKVAWTEEKLSICADGLTSEVLEQQQMSAMRSSIFYVAPLLCRQGRVEFGPPGGCKLGSRPIDIHLDGLKALGAKVQENEHTITCTAPKGLTGCYFKLRLPSVGATETLLMAACTAKGKTTLANVATEPEVCDLAVFLNSCGAKITGAGTGVIHIIGVPQLVGCTYIPMPDRITATTLLCAVAATGGSVDILNARIFHLCPVIAALRSAGAQINQPEKDVLRITVKEPLCGIGKISTAPYPGFATDASPLLAAALLTAGDTTIKDTIFENRFACARQFNKMGAKTSVRRNCIKIEPVCGLHGAKVKAPDLRGGAAIVIAALAATGESRIRGLEHIERGYADIAGLFRALGAEIEEHSN
ncbi:MAG: UDP-N-acetylglucosamine 1-carboxyvinyltransferase [Oscillospiraceae bacterium]|nr:UDP-N-acetylglucosamine 1-carboxyvinyltransferase [Oscillospiraceae bacterium]